MFNHGSGGRTEWESCMHVYKIKREENEWNLVPNLMSY